MDSLSISILQDILRRQGRSLLQYARDAFPWTSPEETAALAEINQIIEDERKADAGIARLLIRHHIPIPYIAPYPEHFTGINFVSLDYLRPLLVENEKRAVNHLERDLALVHDADARAHVQKLLALKETHLKRLESLAVRPAAAGVAS